MEGVATTARETPGYAVRRYRAEGWSDKLAGTRRKAYEEGKVLFLTDHEIPGSRLDCTVATFHAG